MRSNIARTWGSGSVPGVPEAGGRGATVSPLPGPCDPSVGEDTLIGAGGASAGRQAYWSMPRKLTRSLNFLGLVFARSANDGIGAVGLRSVEAIAFGRRIEPILVRLGPGPLLPLSPIWWQASQPDSPTTFSPARKTCFCWAVSRAGGES